jgi:hypothetical protein
MGDRAVVVEKILAVSRIVIRRAKPGRPSSNVAPITNQRFGRHVVARGLHSLGKQPKGVEAVEIGRVDASRHVGDRREAPA